MLKLTQLIKPYINIVYNNQKTKIGYGKHMKDCIKDRYLKDNCDGDYEKIVINFWTIESKGKKTPISLH